MEKLQFERTKYGKELLIDACNEAELEIVADTMVLSFYTLIFFENGSGTYYLDAETIPLEENMVLFVSIPPSNPIYIPSQEMLIFAGGSVSKSSG